MKVEQRLTAWAADRIWRSALAAALGVRIVIVADVSRGNGESLEGLGTGVRARSSSCSCTPTCSFVIFAAMLWLWPKGGAVALAAFREGYRQPMFWLLSGIAPSCSCRCRSFVPYFTFGEDYMMVKQLGFDTIMLAGGAVRRSGGEHVHQRGDRGPHRHHGDEQAGVAPPVPARQVRSASSCAAC